MSVGVRTSNGFIPASLYGVDFSSGIFTLKRVKLRPLASDGSEITETGFFTELRVSVLKAMAVRILLIAHNCLATWRVTVVRDDNTYWAMASVNVLIALEAQRIIMKRNGVEYKWWCPCFFLYLCTTLPAIWLLQLSQYDAYIASQQPGQAVSSAVASAQAGSPDIANTTTVLTSTFTTVMANLTTNLANGTVNTNITEATTTVTETTFAQNTTTLSTTTPTSFEQLLSFDNDAWIIVVEESLVYLLVFGRWLLPRGEVSREYLAELLLEFLAIASDIMELLAIFDEDKVRGNLQVTYAILAIWSLSFFQFVPVLVHKQRFRHIKSARLQIINKVCGEYFAEMFVTIQSILIQDGPFLCLRLYIIIKLQVLNYSLVFFVLKNIVTLMLLFYRLVILTRRLPCCFNKDGSVEEVVSVDLERKVDLSITPDSTLSRNGPVFDGPGFGDRNLTNL